MKTRAFLLRIAACILLSLMPLPAFENTLRLGRIALRGDGLLNAPIWLAPYPVEFILLTFSVLLAAFFVLGYPILVAGAAILGVALTLVGVLFQAIFQVFNVYIPSANILVSLLITYLMFSGYRIAIHESLQERLRRQAEQLRELDRVKTNMLRLLSHDLKTPISKIQALTERLKREQSLPPEQRANWAELLDSIDKSNQELKANITSIVNLSKIESQQVILNRKSNDVNRVIEQALRRLGPQAEARGVSFETSLDPLFSVECDEDLIRQVLTNFLDNAIKYSPRGGIVRVRSREEAGFVAVEVEDDGPGIPLEHLPLLFRKFTRLVKPGQDYPKGTGLGLYLSKYFVELHGGSVRVRSTDGQGACFSFTLPVG